MLLPTFVMLLSIQQTCPPTPPEPWLQDPAEPSGFAEVANGKEVLVREREAEALRLLDQQEAVALTTTEAARFGAVPAGALEPGMRPYLVRAVAANRGSRLMGVYRRGDDLLVGTGSLGCPSYIRRAVVVYLDRPPVRVFPSAMTAL